MGSWWEEEAAVQSGAELRAAGQGLDPLVRDQEALTAVVVGGASEGEHQRVKRGRGLN